MSASEKGKSSFAVAARSGALRADLKSDVIDDGFVQALGDFVHGRTPAALATELAASPSCGSRVPTPAAGMPPWGGERSGRSVQSSGLKLYVPSQAQSGWVLSPMKETAAM